MFVLCGLSYCVLLVVGYISAAVCCQDNHHRSEFDARVAAKLDWSFDTQLNLLTLDNRSLPILWVGWAQKLKIINLRVLVDDMTIAYISVCIYHALIFFSVSMKQCQILLVQCMGRVLG